MRVLVRITLFYYNKLNFGFHNRGISGHADSKYGWVVFGYQEKEIDYYHGIQDLQDLLGGW